MSLLSRGFTAIAIAAAATGMLAPTASAAQSSALAAQLSVILPNVIVGEDTAGKVARLIIASSEPVTATNLKFQLDSSGLTGVATASLVPTGAQCSTAGAVLTCVFPQMFLDEPSGGLPEIVVKPLAGMAPGAKGTWKATISADGLAAAISEATVEVGEAVDLSVPGDRRTITSAPGGVFPQTLEVDNIGDRAADGVVAVVYSDHAFITTKQYSNCTFFNGRMRSCTFDQQLAVDGGYQTNEPVPFKLREDTFAPGSQVFEIEWMTKADFVLFKKKEADLGFPDSYGQPGTGGELTLIARQQVAAKAAQTEIDPSDNFFHLHVKVEGDNAADYAAIGGSAAGTAGQVVTVTFGVKNHGPASRDLGRAGGFATVDFTLPPGSSLAEMPKECRAMRSIGRDGESDPDRGNLATRFLRCENPSELLIVGEQVTFAAKLRIDQVITSATGSVAVLTDGCDGCQADKNPANDAASVVLNGPSLPTTGGRTGLIAGAGALLAFAGAAVLIFSRRRKSHVPS